jgi:hydrogenase nickel incorporation protein HypB
MCSTCGCDDEDGVRLTTLADHHDHDHDHDHPHPHPHEHPHPDGGYSARTVVLEQRVLARNDDLAGGTRAELRRRGVLCVNLMSSPGSGKTTLLERTIADLTPEWPVYVLEGDQETTVDAERIRAAGAAGTVQVNTGAGCHLDAGMVTQGLAALAPPDGALLVVENVGNLVCPALFDLGEAARVVVMSVPEGDEKPLKYPHMFATADLVLLTKTDLLPYVTFDVARCTAHVRAVNPRADVLPMSVTHGEGLRPWYAWLASRRVPVPAPGGTNA